MYHQPSSPRLQPLVPKSVIPRHDYSNDMAHAFHQQLEPSNSATPPTSASPVQSRRSGFTKPACTHVSMSKIYGPDNHCDVCGNEGDTGFIYCCEQDAASPPPHSLLKSYKKFLNPKKRLSSDLEAWGFNHSIVAAANSGHYTRDQMFTLKAQKANVKSTIARVLGKDLSVSSSNELTGSSAINSQNRGRALPPTPESEPSKESKGSARYVAERKPDCKSHDDSSSDGSAAGLTKEKEKAPNLLQEHRQDDSAGQLATTEDEKKEARTRFRAYSRSTQPCDFRCCHTCRPTSRDRSFMSFEAAFSGNGPTETTWQPQKMPVSDARVVANLGLRDPITASTSTASSKHGSVRESIGGISCPGGYPLTRQNSQSERPGPSREEVEMVTPNEKLNQAVTKEFPLWTRPDADWTDSMQRPNGHAQQAISRVEKRRSSMDEKIDALNSLYHESGGSNDKLWEVMQDYLLARAACTNLPGGEDENKVEESSIQGDKRMVAVTEEAAETHSPDIIMSI